MPGLPTYTVPACPLGLKGDPFALIALPGNSDSCREVPQLLPGWTRAGRCSDSRSAERRFDRSVGNCDPAVSGRRRQPPKSPISNTKMIGGPGFDPGASRSRTLVTACPLVSRRLLQTRGADRSG